MNELEEQLYTSDRTWLAYEIGWWSADVSRRMNDPDLDIRYCDALKTSAKILFHYANRFFHLVEKEKAA